MPLSLSPSLPLSLPLCLSLSRTHGSLVPITPGNEQRVPSTLEMATAACKAGVHRLIVISVITAESDTTFGRQFQQIENGVRELCQV